MSRRSAAATPRSARRRRPRALSVLAALVVLPVAALSCTSTESRKGAFTLDLGNAYVSTPDRLTWIGPETHRPFRAIRLDTLQARFRRSVDMHFGAMGKYAGVYDDIMREVLDPTYPIARSSDPGTLRVTASLTDMVSIDELRNHRNNMRHMSPNGMLDRIGLEVQFRDGHSGDLIAAMISTEWAHLYQANLVQPDIRSMYQSLEWFAEALRRALDERSDPERGA